VPASASDVPDAHPVHMLDAQLQIACGQVHVWHTTISSPHGVSPEPWRVLSEDERQRAGRFHFPLHRDRFVNGRAFLRNTLATYQGIEPEGVRFTYTSHGRPELANGSGLVFSLSHSGDFAVLAVSRNRMLGIDVEMIRDDLDILGLARRYFARAEWERIVNAPPHQRIPLFFSSWTCKEAFLKARGLGLLAALDGFEIVFDGVREEGSVRILDQPDHTQWAIRRLNFNEHAAAALAIEGPDYDLHCAPWPGSDFRQALPSRIL
jgi:4'-phosphopantetheinyl transferase